MSKKIEFTKPDIDTEGYTEALVPSDLDEIAASPIIGVDFETVNVDVHDPKNRALCVSFSCTEGISKVVVFDGNSEVIDKAKDILHSKNTKIVAGRPFDEHVSNLLKGIPIRGVVVDVFILSHLLNENQNIDLETLADRYAFMKGIKGLAQGMRDRLQEAPREILIAYAGVDADAVLRVFRILQKFFDVEPALRKYLTCFMQPVQDMFADISLNGCPIDTQALADSVQEVTAVRDKYEAEALGYIPDELKEKYKEDFSFDRSVIITDYLFDYLKLTPEMFTEKRGLPATSEKHLKRFVDVPFIQAYLKTKKAKKALKPCLTSLEEDRKIDGCVYPHTSFIRTRTGRTVMLHPEIQIFHKHGEFVRPIRKCIVAPKEWLLGSRDLSQSELRIIAWLANDQNMLKAFEQGVDIHVRTGKLIDPNAENTPEWRDKSKAVNFGFCYGQGAKGFQQYAYEKYDILFTLNECKAFREAYFSKPDGYYGLLDYHRQTIDFVREHGYVITPLGRKRRLPAIFSNDPALRATAERQAINTKVQSFSSDLGLLAMYLMWEQLKKYNYTERIKLLWYLHDEVIFMARRDSMKVAHVILKECMEECVKNYIRERFGLEIGYSIVSEGKVGRVWADMEEMVL